MSFVITMIASVMVTFIRAGEERIDCDDACCFCKWYMPGKSVLPTLE